MERKSGFSWGYFILGLFFIIVSIVSFNDPVGDLLAIVYVFSFLIIIKGIFELFFRQKSHSNVTSQNGTAIVILGIFDIIIGVFLLFNVSYAIIALPFVFSIWIIVDSVFGIFISGIYEGRNTGTGHYWFNLILCFIGIIIGIMLLFNPVVAALTLAFLVGLYLLMYGIFLIVYAFNY